MKPNRCDVAIDELKKYVSYDADSGYFVRIEKRVNYEKTVKTKGFLEHYGYYRIWVNNLRFLAHRLAWALYYGEWPNDEIDHIDGDGTNNKISNLRLATASQNSMNRKIQENNKSGCKGVHWIDKDRVWCARIRANNVTYTLGRYKNKEDAIAIRMLKEKELFGEYRRAS